MILITPPFASEPYKVDADPLSTSMRSMASIFFNVPKENILDTLPFKLARIPSIRTRTSPVPLIITFSDCSYPTGA